MTLIKPSLTEDACLTLVRGLVISHLDHVNGILEKLLDVTISKMERVQRAGARLVKNIRR